MTITTSRRPLIRLPDSHLKLDWTEEFQRSECLLVMKPHLSLHLCSDDDDDEEDARGSWLSSVAGRRDEASSPPRTDGSSHLSHPPDGTGQNE